jgi:hypothetical protein
MKSEDANINRNGLFALVCGLLCLSSPVLSCVPTKTTGCVAFVNNTGKDVTDFHVTETNTSPGMGLSMPESSPWGKGTSAGNGDGTFTITYAGPAIAPGLSLTFSEGAFANKGGYLFEDFIWTPNDLPATKTIIPALGAPEPSTWAMMLVGLGGLGLVLRSGRRQEGVGARGAAARLWPFTLSMTNT